MAVSVNKQPDRPVVHLVNLIHQISYAKLAEIRQETAKDKSIQLLKSYILNGWLVRKAVLCPYPEKRPYCSFRVTLSYHDGVHLKGESILIPKFFRQKMKDHLNSIHMGYAGMLRRARETEFLIGIHQEIKQLAENCEICLEMKPR